MHYLMYAVGMINSLVFIQLYTAFRVRYLLHLFCSEREPSTRVTRRPHRINRDTSLRRFANSVNNRFYVA